MPFAQEDRVHSAALRLGLGFRVKGSGWVFNFFWFLMSGLEFPKIRVPFFGGGVAHDKKGV